MFHDSRLLSHPAILALAACGSVLPAGVASMSNDSAVDLQLHWVPEFGPGHFFAQPGERITEVPEDEGLVDRDWMDIDWDPDQAIPPIDLPAGETLRITLVGAGSRREVFDLLDGKGRALGRLMVQRVPTWELPHGVSRFFYVAAPGTKPGEDALRITCHRHLPVLEIAPPGGAGGTAATVETKVQGESPARKPRSARVLFPEPESKVEPGARAPGPLTCRVLFPEPESKVELGARVPGPLTCRVLFPETGTGAEAPGHEPESAGGLRRSHAAGHIQPPTEDTPSLETPGNQTTVPAVAPILPLASSGRGRLLLEAARAQADRSASALDFTPD